MDSEAANMDVDQAASVEAIPEAETRDDAPMDEPLLAPTDLTVPNIAEVQIDMDVQEKIQDNQEPAPALEEEEGAQPHADPPVAASDPIEASKVDTIANGAEPAAEETRRSTRRRVKPNESQAKPPEVEPRVTRKRQVKQDTQTKEEEEEKKDAHTEEDPQAEEGEDEKEEAAASKKRGKTKLQVKEGNKRGASAKQQPAKRQRKPAAASVKDESEDAPADDNNDKSTRVSYPAPGLPAYERLSKSDKEEALVAAIEDYEKAYEGLRSASLHLGQHISPWFAHPFVALQDSKLVKTLKRCMTKPDATVLTKNASKATELYNLWRKLHSLDPATAAALKERHGERALTAQHLASFSSSAPATAGAASKVIPPSASVPQPQPPPPAQHEEAPAPPAPAPAPAPAPPSGSTAPHQISLASFCSTGDPSRDKTVAAIFQALFSASCGAADLLDIAVAAEKRVFDASGEEQGAYIRKAFLLWSLCAPESEHYDEGVRHQLLAGQPPDVLSQSF